MSVELFGKFAIEEVATRTPDGKSIYFWNIGQCLASGQIKWSNDHSAQTRDEAVNLGKRLFS